jgi:hypothetical protein
MTVSEAPQNPPRSILDRLLFVREFSYAALVPQNLFEAALHEPDYLRKNLAIVDDALLTEVSPAANASQFRMRIKRDWHQIFYPLMATAEGTFGINEHGLLGVNGRSHFSALAYILLLVETAVVAALFIIFQTAPVIPLAAGALAIVFSGYIFWRNYKDRVNLPSYVNFILEVVEIEARGGER